MKYFIFLIGLTFALAQPTIAGEDKNVKVDGKTYEVRVPKSAKIDCKDAKNADKTECKKQPKEMPKIEKPVVQAPKDEPKKK